MHSNQIKKALVKRRKNNIVRARHGRTWVRVAGEYEVSELGFVRRLYKWMPPRLVKPSMGTAGYLHVCFSSGDKKTTFLVHRLVAKAFFGECPRTLEVNHKDGNKTNNKASNLEYVTRLQNNHHARNIGLTKDRFKNFCQKGHKRTMKNTKTTARGWRSCQTCLKIWKHKKKPKKAKRK